jgi:hypothetical protein
MDYMSGFPSSKHGNNYVFVVVDQFIRWSFGYLVIRVLQQRAILSYSSSVFGFILGSHEPSFQIGTICS